MRDSKILIVLIQTVKKFILYLSIIKLSGRPEKLNEEDIQKIYEEIMCLHSHQPYPIYPTFNDILDFVHLILKKIVKMDILRKKNP